MKSASLKGACKGDLNTENKAIGMVIYTNKTLVTSSEIWVGGTEVEILRKQQLNSIALEAATLL